MSVSINWHDFFMSGLQIQLESYKDILTFEPEYVLNRQSRRIDCLITKIPGTPAVNSAIARNFRHYNLIDYKGPSESMNVINYYKVLSYAYSLPEHLGSADVLDQLSVMLVTHYYPYNLIKHFRKKLPDPIERFAPGMYDIRIEPVPVQLVVLPQLSPEEYIWLRCLTNKLTPEIPLQKLADSYAPHKDETLYQRFMNAFIRANRVAKGEEALMCEALYELFADELIKRELKGRNEGKNEGRNEGRNEGMERLSELNLKLVSENRIPELIRAASDPVYREELLLQYQL